MHKVFDGQATNGASKVLRYAGGIGSIILAGGLGGGSVQLEVSPDQGTTWVAVGDPMTAAEVLNFELPGAIWVRISLSGATAATLDAWIGVVAEQTLEAGGAVPSRIEEGA